MEETESRKLIIQFPDVVKTKMLRILHSPLVHVATNDYITSASLCNLHSNQPLDNHGGARMKTTWLSVTASFLLAQSLENIPKREKNVSVKNLAKD